MAYSFHKLSFIFGSLLIALLVVQTLHPKFTYELKSDEVEKKYSEILNTKICVKQDIPEIYQKFGKLVPQFNVQLAVIATAGCLLLAILFSLLPQNGFFMWFIVRFFTIIFVIAGIFFGIFVAMQPSAECDLIKKRLTTPCSLSLDVVAKNPYTAQILKNIPENYIENVKTFFEMFKENVGKLGIDSPIFVIVIALYLMNKATKDVTKCSITFLIALILSLTTAFSFFTKTQNVVFAVVLPIIAIIVIVVLVNLAITFGYAFVLPQFALSALMIAMRIGHLVEMFNLPVCSCFVTGGIFVFLVLNVFFWTQGKGYLTIIFLMNYGIKILYPLPIESLVILVFVAQVFVATTEKKVAEAVRELPVEEKPKKD